MKRIISVLLVCILIIGMTACGSQNTTTTTAATTAATTEATTEAATEETTEPPVEETTEAPASSDVTPAQALLDGFTASVQAGGFETMEELGLKINEAGVSVYDLASMTVEPGYLNGFTGEITGFTDGAMISPWFGSVPFIAYVFTLEEGTSAEDFINTLKDLADLRWNVCTEADEMAYAVEDGIVCFVMAPASYDE